MKLQDFLYEIDYLLGDFKNTVGVRLIPIPSGLRFETKDRDKAFVAYGQTTESVDGITSICGLLDLSRLRAILRAPGFSRANIEATLKNGTIVLSDRAGHVYSFYLCNERLTNECIKVPPLKIQP